MFSARLTSFRGAIYAIHVGGVVGGVWIVHGRPTYGTGFDCRECHQNDPERESGLSSSHVLGAIDVIVGFDSDGNVHDQLIYAFDVGGRVCHLAKVDGCSLFDSVNLIWTEFRSNTWNTNSSFRGAISAIHVGGVVGGVWIVHGRPTYGTGFDCRECHQNDPERESGLSSSHVLGAIDVIVGFDSDGNVHDQLIYAFDVGGRVCHLAKVDGCSLFDSVNLIWTEFRSNTWNTNSSFRGAIYAIHVGGVVGGVWIVHGRPTYGTGFDCRECHQVNEDALSRDEMGLFD
ncbi:hypothetical protein pipiens_017798 [Culex pipiens pipiens]|uniref:Uncharacterized protein n=1 Tax=Culex pipiens pipiens TaxID=38569 RepID=A0ABD1CF56_CULPP